MNRVLLTSKEVAALLQGLRQTEADFGVEPEPAQELPRPGAPRAMSPRRPGPPSRNRRGRCYKTPGLEPG
ncbi:MAG TPA: hypothetical protein VGA79_00050 [Desulfobaccales bacterium]